MPWDLAKVHPLSFFLNSVGVHGINERPPDGRLWNISGHVVWPVHFTPSKFNPNLDNC
jgi:hypothetical protein